MKVAHIIPPLWLSTFRTTDYHLALAHWALEDRKYLRRMSALGGYLIMDNGVFEDQDLTARELYMLSNLMDVDETILPDSKGEPGETLQKSWSALQMFSNRRVTFVLQGHSPTEQCKAADKWIQAWKDKGLSGYLTFAIPSIYDAGGNPTPGSKHETVAYVTNKYDVQVHLLGIGDIEYFSKTLLPVALRCNVRGVDSSTAFALGASEQVLFSEAQKVRLHEVEYGKLSSKQRRLVVLNQAILEYWVSTGDTEGIPSSLVRRTAAPYTRYWAAGFAKLEEVMNVMGFPDGDYEEREGKIYPLAFYDSRRGINVKV